MPSRAYRNLSRFQGTIRQWILPAARLPSMITKTVGRPCDSARLLLTIGDLEDAGEAISDQPSNVG